MNRRQLLGATVAMAVAGLFVSKAGLAEDKKPAKDAKAAKKTVKCMGNNECKGKGACGAADGSHACAGKNECKGKGWTMTSTDDECTKGGGKVVKEEKKS